MLKHYIEFCYPGSFVAEHSVEPIPDRSTLPEIPKNCYGYRFFDREEINLEGEILKGERKNVSGMVYFGKVLTLDEVKELPDTRTLIANMECNGWDKIVQTRVRWFQPLNPDDVVIDETSAST